MINFIIRSLFIINRIHIHIYIKKNRTNQVTHPVSPNQATIRFLYLTKLNVAGACFVLFIPSHQT